jgi:hypothetical protein
LDDDSNASLPARSSPCEARPGIASCSRGSVGAVGLQGAAPNDDWWLSTWQRFVFAAVSLNKIKCHKTDLAAYRYWLEFGWTSGNFYGMVTETLQIAFVSKKRIHCLVSVLRHVVNFIPTAKPFTQRLLSVQHAVDQTRSTGVPMTTELRLDLEWWKQLVF